MAKDKRIARVEKAVSDANAAIRGGDRAALDDARAEGSAALKDLTPDERKSFWKR